MQRAWKFVLTAAIAAIVLLASVASNASAMWGN